MAKRKANKLFAVTVQECSDAVIVIARHRKGAASIAKQFDFTVKKNCMGKPEIVEADQSQKSQAINGSGPELLLE